MRRKTVVIGLLGPVLDQGRGGLSRARHHQLCAHRTGSFVGSRGILAADEPETDGDSREGMARDA